MILDVDIHVVNIVKYLELLTFKCTNNPRIIYQKKFLKLSDCLEIPHSDT